MRGMWRLLDLGDVDGYTMTNLYEAVGRAVSVGFVPNTVILNHPSGPFVEAVSGLEEALVGVALEEGALVEAGAGAYERLGLMVFGAVQEDFVAALLKARVES